MREMLETIYIIFAGIVAVCLPSLLVAVILLVGLKWIDVKKDEDK